MRAHLALLLVGLTLVGCDCGGPPLHPLESCDNARDDDDDGQIDCADADCLGKGACADCIDRCENGARVCDDDGLRECRREFGGCLTFSPPAACPSGSVCSGGRCIFPCADQCTEGALRCVSAAAALKCARLATGCLEWTSPMACGAGQVCSGGVCAADAGCVDQCLANSTMCTAGLEQRCLLLSSGCREWSLPSGACEQDGGTDGGGTDGGWDAGVDGGCAAPTQACDGGCCAPVCGAPEVPCATGCCLPTGWCSQDDWCWENPLPQGNAIRALWASSPSDVWAVGNAGLVMHFDGGTWGPVNSGTTEHFTDLLVFGANDAVALSSTYFSSTARRWNGTVWSPMPAISASAYLTTLWGNTNDFWALGLDTGASMAHGERWGGGAFAPASLPSGARIHDAWGTGPDILTVGDFGGGAPAMNRWNGTTWTAMAAPPGGTTLGIWGVSVDDFWVSQSSGFAHSASGTWTTVGADAGSNWEGLWGTSASDLWAGSQEGHLAHWDGGSWTVTREVVRSPLWAISGSSPRDVWAGGLGGALAHWDGAAWTRVADSETPWIADVAGASATDLWAVGGAGGARSGRPVILHGDGQKWSKSSVPSSRASDQNAFLASITMLSATQGWAVGNSSTGPFALALTGAGWVEAGSLPLMTVSDVWAADATHVFAVGGSTTLGQVAMWNGTAWSASGCGSGDFFAVHGTSATNVWAVGRNGSTCRYDGSVWSVRVTTVPSVSGFFLSLWVASATDAFAGDGQGKIFRWNGSAWVLSTTAQPSGNYFVSGLWGRSATEVYAVGAIPYYYDYASGNGNFLLRFDGTTWTRQVVPTLNYLTSVWGTGSSVWVSGGFGTVLRKR